MDTRIKVMEKIFQFKDELNDRTTDFCLGDGRISKPFATTAIGQQNRNLCIYKQELKKLKYLKTIRTNAIYKLDKPYPTTQLCLFNSAKGMKNELAKINRKAVAVFRNNGL